MRYLSLLTFLLLSVSSDLYSQRVSKKSSTVTLSDRYYGEESFFYYKKDTSEIKHGKYLFNSDIFKSPENDGVRIEKTLIGGSYDHGKKDKLWELKKISSLVNIKDLSGTKDLNLDYHLFGHEIKVKMNFDKGTPQGRWEEWRNTVENNRLRSEKLFAYTNFRSGVASGEFYLEDTIKNTHVMVKGEMNSEGFFDKTMEIIYKVDSTEFLEKRLYDKGFLLKIEVINRANDSIVQAIHYEDVGQKLAALNGNNSNGNFRISDKGFGVTFDNGYQFSDPKWSAQLKGNRYLFMLFQKFDSMVDFVDSTEKPVFNLTRRFQYIYPDTDDSMIVQLKPKIKRLAKDYQTYLESPKYILAKQKSDSLAYAYAYINHAYEKIKIVEEVIEKIESGYFDFLYRSNFYAKGVKGLNKADTINYEFSERKKKVPFDIGKKVDSPEGLLVGLNDYLDALNKAGNSKVTFSDHRIQYYQEQEKVNNLDAKIVRYSEKVDSLYAQEIVRDRRGSEDMTFRFKVYNLIYNKILKDLSLSYINETEFSKKVSLGGELVCFLESFENSYSDLIIIEGMPKSIDSTFTQYQSNPFHTRKMESKVLGNMERAGLKLFYTYVEGLTKVNTCKDFKLQLQLIFRLKQRLEYLANNSDEGVQKMDRALRRENVPSRIERILGLGT